MADIKFSEFPKANQSKDSDEIAILQDGVNKMIASPVLESKIINKTVSRVIEQGGASLNVINLKGVVPTYADLATITPTPELNDAYQVEADGLVYVYTENGFQADGDGFIVQPEPIGIVEEGNTQAVSGGEVFDAINGITTIMPINLSTPSPEQNGIFQPTEIGIYENFGGLALSEEELENNIVYFYYLDGVFSKQVKGVLTVDEVTPEGLNAVNGKAVFDYTNQTINTIADLRLFNGKEGQIITLLGYYEAGDKEPLNYKWNSEQGVDDGGAVINTESGSWEVVSRESINVLDFGAIGDGISDDTNAFKKCFSFLNANTSIPSFIVYVPQGTYIVKEELLIDRSSVKIKGDGFSSIIKAGAEIRSIFKLNDLKQNNRSFYESLCLDGGGLADYCFNGINSHHTRISKSRFMGSKVSAILLSGWCNDIVDCEVSYNSGNGISILNENNNAVNILRNRIFLNEGIGVYVRTGIRIAISNNTIEGNKKTGVYIQFGVISLSITNNYFESNAVDGFLFTAPAIKVHSTIILNGSTNASVVSAAFNSEGIDISNNSISSHVQDAVMIFTSGAGGGKIYNNTSMNVPDNGGEVLGVYLDSLHFNIKHKKLNLENNIVTNFNSAVTYTNRIRVYGISNVRPTLSLLTNSNILSNKNYIDNNVLSMILISDAPSGYVRRSANKYLGKEVIDLGSDVAGLSKSYGRSISVDDHPELAGKLLNFEFKAKSNTEGTGIYCGVLGSTNYNVTSSLPSGGWEHLSFVILMPTTGMIRLYFAKYGNPGSVSIADPILKIVGVDSNIFYTTTIPPIWKSDTPPTTGQWNVGDVIWKKNPSINTNVGWVHDGSSFVEFGKKIPIASQSEVNAGTDNTKAVTSLTLENKLKKGVVSEITTADATDEATAIALANVNKAKVNEIITKLSTIIFK